MNNIEFDHDPYKRMTRLEAFGDDKQYFLEAAIQREMQLGTIVEENNDSVDFDEQATIMRTIEFDHDPYKRMTRLEAFGDDKQYFLEAAIQREAQVEPGVVQQGLGSSVLCEPTTIRGIDRPTKTRVDKKVVNIPTGRELL